MKAAVVRSFDSAPYYEDFAPPAAGQDEIEVRVLAAGLHPRVRSGAAGQHYADRPVLPLIPGVDAVGETADGRRVYCVVQDTPFGTMAERVVVDRRHCVQLPADVDPAVVAAAMNPAMSSWLALRLRAPLKPGQKIFILGATGNAGRMAIQVAKLLGAGPVIGAGRNLAALEGCGADAIVPLDADAIGEAAGDADIVLDYLWGEPAAQAMVALLTAREDRSRPLDWVQIGAIAGATMPLPAAALRSTNLRVMGSGQGSIPGKTIVAELPALVEHIAAGRIAVDVRRMPLAEVHDAWAAPETGQRIVLMP